MKNLTGWFFLILIGFNYSIAQPRKLDPSFGNSGKVIIQSLIDHSLGEHAGMAIQLDGKIVLAGTTANTYTNNQTSDFIVFRLMPDGKLDSSFGKNGSVVIDYFPEDYIPNPGQDVPRFFDDATDVAITPDGKIVVAGGSWSIENGESVENYSLVVRLNSNGSKDIGFDGDGVKAFNLGGDEMAEAVSVLSDGTILLAGRLAKRAIQDPSGPPSDMMVIKLKTDGQFDESFGLNGVSIIDMGQDEEAHAMIVQQDGKIIIGGGIYYASTESHAGSSDFALVRLLADGKPDPSFSGDGILIFDMGAQFAGINGIAIQQDEKIVITGYYYENNSSDIAIPVARINKDGTFDFGFNYGGTKVIRTNGPYEVVKVVLVDQRNNIVLGVVSQQVPLYGDHNFGVFRLTPEGNLDTLFDGDGKVYVDFGGDDFFSSMQFQTDGKLVLAGRSNFPRQNGNYAIARLLYESNPLIVARSFVVTVLNNPTRNQFSLSVEGSSATTYSIRISDISGRIIEYRDKVPVGTILKFGSDYSRGIYFGKIRQGKQEKIIKLIKN